MTDVITDRPLVRRTLEALDSSGVDWLLLRGADEPPALGGDLDLLIPPGDWIRARRALTEAGFLQVQALGHDSHRFFVGHDPGSGDWLRLDVVTRIRFGQAEFGRAWTLPTADVERLLARATRTGRMWLPHPSDAFWLLFLHAAIDKGADRQPPDQRIRPDHERELKSWAGSAGTDGPVAALASTVVPVPLATVISAAAAGHREVLGSYAMATARRARSRVGRTGRARPGLRLDSARRMISGTMGRAGRRLGGRLSRGGRIVAVLGPDGAGKTTLVDALSATLPLPLSRCYLGLPKHGTVGRLICRLPLGWITLRAIGVTAVTARTTALRRAGRLVILDRHPLDDVSAADRWHLTRRETAKRALIRALAPRPDLIIVLDAPAEEMFARKAEHDVATLEAARTGYLGLAASDHRAVMVDALQSPVRVRRDVESLLWEALCH